jgi:hypothetical protein
LMYRNREFRCRDCGGIYDDNDFIRLPATDTPWPTPVRSTPVRSTPRHEWISRRFLSS